MKAVHKIAVVGAVLAAAGLTTAATASASHGSSSHTETTVERTIVLNGNPLTFGQDQRIPQMRCPDSAEFVLNKQYNPGSGFRITSGVELSDYKPGFDAYVAHKSWAELQGNPKQEVAVGLTVKDQIWEPPNSVSYWGFETTSFKLTLHCTSDINQAQIINRPN
jgi:hypothetical protein